MLKFQTSYFRLLDTFFFYFRRNLEHFASIENMNQTGTRSKDDRFTPPSRFYKYKKNNTMKFYLLCMSSSDSNKVRHKETKHFAATSRFYTVLTIFQMFKILYPKKNRQSNIKIIQSFFCKHKSRLERHFMITTMINCHYITPHMSLVRPCKGFL